MEKIKLPHSLIIIAVLLVLGFLAWKQIDSAPIVVGALGILTALGFVIKQGAEQGERVSAVQATVNGNTSRLVEMLAEDRRSMQVAHEAFAAQMTTTHEAHVTQMRELIDKVAEMVPASMVAMAPPVSAPPAG